MAYVLSEELQRRKLLSQRPSLWGVNLFGSLDGQVEDPCALHSTNDWDISLQEIVASLHETGEGVPPLDLDSTRIEHVGDNARRLFSSAISPSSISTDAYEGNSVGDRVVETKINRDDPHSKIWAKKTIDEDAEAVNPGTVSAPKLMSTIENGELMFRGIMSSPVMASESTKTDTYALMQGAISSAFLSESFRDDINLIFDYMAQSAKHDKETLLSSGVSTSHSQPLAHSTPCSSTRVSSSNKAFSDSDWTAILYNEFRNRMFEVSSEETLKCEFDCSRIDKDLLDFVRKIFDINFESTSSRNKANERTVRGICYVLIEMRMVGLDIKKHLILWHNTWIAKASVVKAFTNSLFEMSHSEIRYKLLDVSFEFNDSHRVLLNCVLMLYRWKSTRRFSTSDQDVDPKDVLQKKGEKDFARLKSLTQTSEYDSDLSDTNYNFSDKLNASNEDAVKSVSDKSIFFDELEWQAILFEELKIRIRNELSLLVAGKKSLYEEEDGLRIKNFPDFIDVIHEVFPEVSLEADNLTHLAKIFSGLARFTQFNFSRHVLQWHSVYKSQPDALKRYERETVSYAWLISELNFLNYLENHPLRLMIDCLLMLSIDSVDNAAITV